MYFSDKYKSKIYDIYRNQRKIVQKFKCFSGFYYYDYWQLESLLCFMSEDTQTLSLSLTHLFLCLFLKFVSVIDADNKAKINVTYLLPRRVDSIVYVLLSQWLYQPKLTYQQEFCAFHHKKTHIIFQNSKRSIHTTIVQFGVRECVV